MKKLTYITFVFDFPGLLTEAPRHVGVEGPGGHCGVGTPLLLPGNAPDEGDHQEQ